MGLLTFGLVTLGVGLASWWANKSVNDTIERFGELGGEAFKVLQGILFSFDKFPLNIVAGLVALNTIFLEAMLLLPFIGETLIIVIYIVPFTISFIWKHIVFVFYVLLTAILQLFDPEDTRKNKSTNRESYKSFVKKLLIWLQSCNPDPRGWYLYGNNHLGNTFKKQFGVLCMRPCAEAYIPTFRGLLCQRTSGRLPNFCPRAVIMRAIEGLSMQGTQNRARGKVKKEHDQACEAADFANENTDALLLAACQQGTISTTRPSQIQDACREVFCSGSRREPFCERLKVSWTSNAWEELLDLAKIPAIVLFAAVILAVSKHTLSLGLVTLAESKV